jgi:transcriptional regulator with XRE-family HTH domain
MRSFQEVVVRARQKLGMTQVQMAEAVGTSVRTLSRWEGGQSGPADLHCDRLAALVYPVDRELARDAAGQVGKTLESLGLEKPAPPPAAAPAPTPPPLPRSPSARVLVDAVVCAVASTLEAIEGAPVAIARARAAAASALRAARDVGLELDAAIEALAPAQAPDAQAKAKADGGRASAEAATGKGRK